MHQSMLERALSFREVLFAAGSLSTTLARNCTLLFVVTCVFICNHNSLLLVPSSPSPNHISLGELSGNKFSIVLRGAKVPRRAVESSLEEACLRGFVNFFGTQRVGSPSAAARGQPMPYQASSFVVCGMILFSRQLSLPEHLLNTWSQIR